MACREDEAVAVGPQGVGGVVLQEPGPDDKGSRRQAEGGPGVSRIRLFNTVDAECPDGVHAPGEQAVFGLGSGGDKGAQSVVLQVDLRINSP